MSRKRKRGEGEAHENHERWLVSYADFITLLFAFFVVMYAVSSINEGKYRVLSQSLVSAFKSNQTANLVESKSAEFSAIQLPQQADSAKTITESSIQNARKQKKMQHMAKSILQALEPLVKDGQVRVTQSAVGITVEINASVLFSPGQAKLAENSMVALQAVAHVVKDHEHEIHVEGHTDNMPIHNDNFPSNWELSTARASSVIRLFVENGVDAHRLTAIGYGENRPIESNETAEGRKRNRRVTVMILAADPNRVTELPIHDEPVE